MRFTGIEPKLIPVSPPETMPRIPFSKLTNACSFPVVKVNLFPSSEFGVNSLSLTSKHTIVKYKELTPIFIEGFLRFECPHCHQLRATVNPKNNLAHCFCCQKNINNIDLMIAIGYDFKQAVHILEKWLQRYNLK